MKRYALFLLSCCLLLVGCQSHDSSDNKGTTLRVATWNIGANPDSSVPDMLDQITSNNIEIVGLQEVDINNDRNDYDMLSEFKSETYEHLHWAKGRDYANGYFGLGIVSSFAFLQSASIPVESTSSNATKVIEKVVFEKEGKVVSFYNVHLSWENESLRKRQFQELIDRVNNDENEYKIIVGDFNADQNNREYKMFAEQFTYVNGYKDRWIETFPDKEADPAMKSYSIDNILVTKNIQIDGFKSISSDLSDHEMLYSDLKLLDDATVETVAPKDRNIALAQLVTVLPESEQDNYILVDGITNNNWKTVGEVEITLELDRIYHLSDVKLYTNNKKVDASALSFSLDGENYTDNTAFDMADLVEIECNQYAKFVKVSIESSSEIVLSEVMVYGEPANTTIKNSSNLLTSTLNTDAYGGIKPGWSVVSNNPAVSAIQENDAISISNLMGNGYARLNQLLQLEGNKTYKLAFDVKGNNVDSSEFTLRIQQFDRLGAQIKTYSTQLKNNLLINENYETFLTTFVTAPNVNLVIISIEFSNSEGQLFLKSAELSETVKTQMLTVKGSHQMKIGESQTLETISYPTNATDYSYHWVTSDPSVAEVDASGVVTALKKGTVVISRISNENLILESSIFINVE
ncbi:hypothetical protein AOC36_10660 [Erysipelothrix larvae]|uniref:BIG2 domain-containing protein n=1 Tax=Erysipelothrix larvae TaxID=1514105 RepID=A0A0X8H1Q5_9FIRM|nr:endonuclease/exonuclease/phosphatase family protein [Erysipelothrix larvae]AMC94415.1 hypothetical protein AOC36_10660 [Erysipelothrix larvae]